MSIIVGFTKMTYFAKPANLARTETMNKKGMLTVGDLHKNGKFEKMGNWARIHQRSGKTSFEVIKRGILRKGRFRQIWRVCQKNHQGFGQIFK